MQYTELKAHKLRDYHLEGWEEKIAGRWHYRELAGDPAWRDGWISFDSITWNPDDGAVWCGLNSIDGDLLYRFDPKTETFQGLESQRFSDEFDSKIHRNLLYNPAEQAFYFATSLLHDVDQQREAAGGKIVRYDVRADRYDVLGIPAPMLYIQSLAADWGRGLLYGFTYPAESFFLFDLATRKAETLAYTGNSLFFSQPHNPVVDGAGWVWGTYAETRAWDEKLSATPIRLFKFHPDERRFVWFQHGLPRKADPEQLLADPPMPETESLLHETRHTVDYGFCDSMLFDGHHSIYAGTVAGVLARIDTRTDQVEKVATVMGSGRFPALALGPDGTLYGAGGMRGKTQVVRWRPQSERVEVFSHLLDPAIGEAPARIHEMAVGPDHRLYLGENDNHHRSSYLWSGVLPK